MFPLWREAKTFLSPPRTFRLTSLSHKNPRRISDAMPKRTALKISGVKYVKANFTAMKFKPQMKLMATSMRSTKESFSFVDGTTTTCRHSTRCIRVFDASGYRRAELKVWQPILLKSPFPFNFHSYSLSNDSSSFRLLMTLSGCTWLSSAKAPKIGGATPFSRWRCMRKACI